MTFNFFEPITGNSRFPSTEQPLVKIIPTGNIYLNDAVVQKWFKTKTYVKIGYDEERNFIALKPQEESLRAYKLTRMGKHNTAVLQVRSFFLSIKTQFIRTQIFDPYWDEKEKLIVINLNKPL